MAHDADIAQRHLIKETRDSYEMDKIHKKFDKLSERIESMEALMKDIRDELKGIKSHLGMR